jgi:hypothetical protein
VTCLPAGEAGLPVTFSSFTFSPRRLKMESIAFEWYFLQDGKFSSPRCLSIEDTEATVSPTFGRETL